MNYASIDNHWVYPAADDEAFYASQPQSEVMDLDFVEEMADCYECGLSEDNCTCYEPITLHPSFPALPDTAIARAWKKAAMEVCK